ncbi:MAG TPA: hypothetical protein PKK69_00930 [Ferruginibacter sp.]|nr:hypothetical protein [Ferruginibacter sp.]
MRLAKSITNGLAVVGVFLLVLIGSQTFAQENSPYSRYGLGDLVPTQNIAMRGMGGISAGMPSFQNINFSNPASLGNINNYQYTNTIFDLGGEVDIHTLKSNLTPDKYKSTNAIISYLQLAFPIASQKMERKKKFWAVSLGLRPLTRISYKIRKDERLNLIGDSLQTLYEGSGGLYQANIGTGLRIKNFSIGINTGYTFGRKDYSTRLIFENDSVAYYKTNTEAITTFGGVFLNTGVQYSITTKNKGMLVLGGYLNWQNDLNANRNKINETFTYSSTGAAYTIDTVDYRSDETGKIKMPVTYGIGFTYQDKERNWLLGADFEASNWSRYRFYNETDDVRNSWMIRVGAQYLPWKQNAARTNYWSFVKYRAGFQYGIDYIKVVSNQMTYNATLGMSFPLTSLNRIRLGETVSLNTSIEFGGRVNNQSLGLRDNYLRFGFGVSMNARWFQKRNYD